MKKISIYAFLFSFFSCSTNQHQLLNSALLKSNPEKSSELSFSELKQILTQNESMGGGLYQLAITPITPDLIEKKLVMDNLWRQEPPDQLQLLIQSLKKEWVQTKTCFQFEAIVLKHEQAGHFDSWQLTLLTDLPQVGEGEEEKQTEQAKKYPLHWIVPHPSIVKSSVYKVHDKLDQWILSSMACSDYPVDLSKNFAIQSKVSYINFPFPDTIRFDWQVYDETITTEKTSIDNKESSSTQTVPNKGFQRYRGW